MGLGRGAPSLEPIRCGRSLAPGKVGVGGCAWRSPPAVAGSAKRGRVHESARAKDPQAHAAGRRDIVGHLDDAKVAAILATGASARQLEEAKAWAAGESDVMGELERPLDVVVGRLYDILTTGEEFPEDRD